MVVSKVHLLTLQHFTKQGINVNAGRKPIIYNEIGIVILKEFYIDHNQFLC